MNTKPNNIQARMRQIAVQAGKISLEYRDKLSKIRIDRKSPKDLVTEADTAVENYIVSQIRRIFPEHSILGEETGFVSGNDNLWIIDPIDGTTSFVHGHPSYCISIAFQKAGKTIFGTVYAPVLEELFEAELDHGVTLNGNPIHVSDCSTLKDCVFNTGFACLRSDWQHNNLLYLKRLAPEVRGIRMSGSAALDLAFVACGRSEGSWELNLNIYDVAAGILLVTEAGGTVTDFTGSQNNMPTEVFASNGLVHNQLIKLFTEAAINTFA